MWTDNETSLDLLGFRVHADLIHSVVTDPNLLPVTLGVFADWGGGKTSLMKMLEESFAPEHWEEGSVERKKCERTACLYFNGWLFEGYDDAKSAILSSVLMALGEHKRFGPKVRDGCVSLLKSVNWMRAAHLGLKHVAIPAIAAYVTGGASIVPRLADSVGGLLPGAAQNTPDANPNTCQEKGECSEIDWESLIKKDQSKPGPLDVRTFREKFGQLLKDSDIDSLVVLIDDLDRCSPERIIENLEAIKLFLNVENTAFVIGADPRIVRHAIAWKYKDYDGGVEDEAPTIVTDYLEKLIQYPYRLPRLSPAEIETYMALLFCQAHLSDELFESAVTACDDQRIKDRYSVFGYFAVREAVTNKGKADPLPDDLVNALIFSAGASPLITEGLKGNPRQVKRFLNAFVLRKKLAEVAKLTNINDDILVKLMILEYSNDKKFREVYEWQASQAGVPEQLIQFERAVADEGEDAAEGEERPTLPEDWRKPTLVRWLKMKPALAGEDLRDYFWIARDRLQSSISGMSMVPPIVRRVFEGLTSDNAGMKTQAAKSAGEFDENESEMLFKLLLRNVKQNPHEKPSFDAYRTLIEVNLGDAANQLAIAVREVPAPKIPPAVGSDLLTLVKAKPELNAVFASVLDELRETDTHVGRMIQQLTKNVEG
jgi:hypothetical protein